MLHLRPTALRNSETEAVLGATTGQPRDHAIYSPAGQRHAPERLRSVQCERPKPLDRLVKGS